MARKKIIAGNWKMNMTPSEAVKLVETLKPLVVNDEVDVVFCVPAIDIIPVVEAAKGTNIQVGAENMYFEEKGAYTGEIAPAMLVDAGVKYVVLGHSEVTGLKIRNIKTNEERELTAEGVFIAVGIVPNTTLVKDQLKLDENGYICAGEEGVTSAPGVFVAGDIRTKALRQIVTAVSDGANAVASAQKYLWRKDNGND